MKRFYYVDDNLDELEDIEQELESSGIPTEQIHILSNDDLDVAHHHLHSVTSLMKKDLVRSTVTGAIVGAVGAVLVLIIASMTTWPETYTWMPFVFLAIVVLGFCAWEGGLYGIQEPNREFRRFVDVLNRGDHILFVDITAKETAELGAVLSAHPKLKPIGTGNPAPWFVVRSQEFVHWLAKWGP